jgi:hypothetical protein
MAFQNPNQREKDPIINHSTLVKGGPKLLTIATTPKTITRKADGKRFHMITLSLDGVNHTYFIPNQSIEEAFKQYVGKTVVVIASGNDKQGTGTMEIQAAIGKAWELGQNKQQDIPREPQKPAGEAIKNPEPKDREAKAFLCQAANLMRLCVKKANDIAVELDLPNEHRQGIASSLFIQADRSGLTFKMPINAYSPEDLGWGASKADSLAIPQPEELND